MEESWLKTQQYIQDIAIPLSECIEPWTEASAVEQAVTLMAGNEDDEAQLFHAISAIFASKPVLKTCYQHLSVSRHMTYHHHPGQEQTLLKLDHLMSFLPSLLISMIYIFLKVLIREELVQLKIEHEELTRYVERLGPQMQRCGVSLEDLL